MASSSTWVATTNCANSCKKLSKFHSPLVETYCGAFDLGSAFFCLHKPVLVKHGRVRGGVARARRDDKTRFARLYRVVPAGFVCNHAFLVGGHRAYFYMVSVVCDMQLFR